jgi:carbonic anhydrase/acetyltransferase-like protein (isoleucine patch superfamily)
MLCSHALITDNKTFPTGSLIICAPERVARELSEEEIASIGEAADQYVDNAARFRETLKAID